MRRAAMGILDSIRKELRPKHVPDIDKHLTYLQTAIQKVAPNAVIFPGGSFAKGTFINGSHDIDVFVRFTGSMTDEQMSKAIKKALPKATTLHGSRDYFQLKRAGYVFELVPVLAIDDWHQAKNSMDMSVFHVSYVMHHLTPTQKDDARLAKQFTKAHGIYGAESYIRGFSGYVLELLVSVYGSFEKLLRASTGWHAPVFIDPAKHYASKEEALKKLNEAKTLSPIILVDPVQPDRNAAAALSHDSFEKFKHAASKFVQKPNKSFFDAAISTQKIKSQYKGKQVLLVQPKTPRGKQDVVGCKVLAKHETAVRLLKEHEFPLIAADWRFGTPKSLAWYVLTETTLPKDAIQRGPPGTMPEAVQAFRKRHKQAYEANGRWYARIRRKYTKAQQILKTAYK